ncbi:MAG: sigma-70 family RNA polymerase sigma factor [Bryobacterales bacterium]|nr:sigma-70 family RNA polymerase sigma factor [Bryobacterales bacterium]
MDSANAGSVTVLMSRFRQGDHEATRKLVELLYPELRRLASGRLRAGHTWQPTALVNELFLELVKIKALNGDGYQGTDEKASFLRFSAFLMNRLLSHHERPLYRKAIKTELTEGPDRILPGAETLHHLDNVLERLARVDPKLRTVVELKVFAGLTGDEIAEQMGCSRKSVSVYWTFAKNQLKDLMAPAEKN